MASAVPSLVDQLLREQQTLTAVETFARQHAQSDAPAAHTGRYESLIPLTTPQPGERYVFEVNLDACTGCKACVTACHNLNGLDAGETWRRVGALVGTSAAAVERQPVTAACHHCEEPGCLAGCPVRAYEQDAVTGIVRHLDDQCIGCQYCVLMCPYDVPQYSAARGIVRKCDMCSSRLAVGEAPACAQGCPNDAIAIRLAPRTGHVGFVLPGAPDPSITRPTTVYRGTRRRLSALRAADQDLVTPAHGHAPLVFMLALTQLAVGMLAASVLSAAPAETAAAAWLVLAVGMGASVLHLGQPLKAWRVFLGVRTSWISREVLVFGAFFGAAAAYVVAARAEVVVAPLVGAIAAGLGLMGVACSVAVYHVTRRAMWAWQRTAPMFGSAMLAGGAATALVAQAAAGEASLPLVTSTAIAALLGPLWSTYDLRAGARIDAVMARATRVLRGPLRRWTIARLAMAAVAALGFPIVGVLSGRPLAGAVVAWLAVAVGTLIERQLFFTAAVAPRMPGEG